MEMAPVFNSLLLLLLANGAPVIARHLLGEKLAFPVDARKCFFDGRPWFGTSKTARGIIISIAATAGGAIVLGYPPTLGALFATLSMAGDLISSFIKRRLALPPGYSVVGLDQIPESLLPLLICWNVLALTPATAIMVLAVFLVVDLALSKMLSRLPFFGRSR